MSEDLVKRLRFSGEYVTYTPTERCVTPMPPDDLRIAAADEIERLRAQVAKLREALVRFADYADKTDRLFTDPMWSDWEPIMITLGSCRRARAALKEAEQ